MTQLDKHTHSYCFYSAIISCVFLAGTMFAQPRPQPRPNLAPRLTTVPNIILIVADDLGYGDLGSYGQKKIKTPNLDRLAAEGMRFTQYYAGSTIGNASRAAMMTGQHSGHGHIRGNDINTSLRMSDVTMAQFLQPAGFETVGVGKWNLGTEGSSGEPFKKGFMHWVGFVDQVHADNNYPSFLWRYEPGFKGVNAFHGKVPIHQNRDGRRLEYSQDLLTKAATNTIRVYHPSPESGYRPFFLYLAYTAPHANADLFRKTGNGMEVPSDAPYEAERWPLPEKNKAAMITRLDADIGKILASLKNHKCENDTVVIFTSDNGPHAEGGNDPSFFNSTGGYRGIKRSLHEGGIRVPMIVRWPGKVQPNTVSHQVWAAWDLLPTICQIARTPGPRDIDGISMFPTLIGLPQQEKHNFLYWEFHEGGSKQAARKDQWKAIRPALGKPLELYDLYKDPIESKNVAAENPDVVRQFEDYLRTARTKSDTWPLTSPAAQSASTQPNK